MDQDAAAQRRKLGGVIFVTLTLIAWSSVPLFLKYFASHIDAWTANGWRYGVSAVLWGPVLIFLALRKKLPPGLWRAAVVPSLFNCLGQSCFAWAPYFIDPGLMTFVLRFQILFVTAGAYLLFPTERVVIRSVGFWVGIAIVFLGATGVLLMGHEPPRGATFKGVLLALGGGILFAGYSLSVRYYMHRTNPIIAFSAISVYTSLVLALVMVLFARSHGMETLNLTGSQFALLIVSALVGIAFSHAMYYAGLIRLGVAVTSGIVLLQPILTATASYFIFREHMTVGQWLCGLGSLFGAGILLSAQHRATRTPVAPIPPLPCVAPLFTKSA
ncbi:MAG: DMT family transporter [Planctomycetota bacterium]